MAKIYCINCGEAVEGAFCATCGTAVAASAATADAPAAEPTYSAPTSQAPTDGTQRSLQTGRLGYRAAIKSYFANYVNFEGRATQSAYWYAALFVFLLGLVANLIVRGDTSPFSTSPLASVVSLGTLLPNISVGVRRLHDTGRSGHYIWFGLIPIVGWILLIVWLASPSDPADNKYGPRA
jgi:uncharacterized membrane protein YhaH (DUF805 family)